MHVACFCLVCFTYTSEDRKGNMFQCQTYICTINATKEGEASLLKKKKKKKK